MNAYPFKVSRGRPRPYGTSLLEDGINFALVSTSAKHVSLCLFNSESKSLLYEIPLDARSNKTGDVWHLCLHGLPADLLYGYRLDGTQDILLDPYAKSVVTSHEWGKSREEASGYFPLGALIQNSFDWEEDVPPAIPLEKMIIYEMHVRGFTQDASSKVEKPGSYLGIIEKIPHLLDLGINAIELLPIHEFDETENLRINPLTSKQLYNYWGYSTVNFFSPMQRYATTSAPSAATKEFKTLVKELHRNGIEVILDVVFNHTAEGNKKGPIYSFKALDNEVYYILDSAQEYLNYSGCGNTMNCNHPIVRELIRDSLRYWVEEMHVDGFRFDLASILTRGCHGQPLVFSPLIEAITHDPMLSQVKLIAEPWDAAGLYQVGSFFAHGGKRWSEWNARYRDVVRRFIRGTGSKGEFVTNLCGSQDFYYAFGPCCSVNFVTAHDGFTLKDLVTYQNKHNEANGEDNLDGLNDNESWNCGVEGATQDKKILSIRSRQIRNFHLALMLSKGIPMLFMGDEYAHTKKGNNNSWCQDNEINWFLWNKLEENIDFFTFYKRLIHFRKQHPILCQNEFFSKENIEWHGVTLLNPHWELNDQLIAFTLKNGGEGDLYAAFNASNKTIVIELPHSSAKSSWHWIINTGSFPPHDFYKEEDSPVVNKSHYQMIPYSAILLKELKN